jgi:hypothetical protein
MSTVSDKPLLPQEIPASSYCPCGGVDDRSAYDVFLIAYVVALVFKKQHPDLGRAQINAFLGDDISQRIDQLVPTYPEFDFPVNFWNVKKDYVLSLGKCVQLRDFVTTHSQSCLIRDREQMPASSSASGHSWEVQRYVGANGVGVCIERNIWDSLERAIQAGGQVRGCVIL